MSWPTFFGHTRQREMFERARSRGRLGHAFLLVGRAGIGKRTFARHLAQGLLCETSSPESLAGCGECAGCRQVISGSHPDLLEVGLPEGKSELPIEVFVGSPERRGKEGLCHDLSLAPMHGGYRIAIIDDADQMSIAGANALLKTLEEPGPKSILILIAESADQVIQTIRSRCQQVNFGLLTPAEIEQALQLQADLLAETKATPDLLARASQAGQGSVGSAQRWLENQASQTVDPRAIARVLGQGGFRLQDLVAAGEKLLAQFGSDTSGQRDGAFAILTACLEHCHDQLLSAVAEDHGDLHRCDAWADAVELCLDVSIQIERRAGVLLCLDAFYQELEIRLRPTWKIAGSRS